METSVSASVIRNLAQSIFQIDPTKVYLAGEIDPEYRSISSRLSGGMWYSEEETTLWGFSPKTGFKELKEIKYDEWNVSDGIPQDNRNKVLKLNEVPKIGEYIFFLEKREVIHSVPSNGIDRNETNYILYKAPNFREYWEKIEKEDLERWSSWINNN